MHLGCQQEIGKQINSRGMGPGLRIITPKGKKCQDNMYEIYKIILSVYYPVFKKWTGNLQVEPKEDGIGNEAGVRIKKTAGRDGALRRSV
jgi:hypothetical protein